MHWEHRVPKPKIARLMDVHRSTVCRIVEKARKTASVVGSPLQRGPHRVLDGTDCAVSKILCVPLLIEADAYWFGQYLESLIERTPDILLRELKEALESNRGVSVSIATIHRTLLRRGFTLKKNTFVAKERVEANRLRYMINIAESYHPDQLVFVDESAMNRLTTRRSRGWAPVGCRSRRRDFFIRGKRYVHHSCSALELLNLMTL